MVCSETTLVLCCSRCRMEIIKRETGRIIFRGSQPPVYYHDTMTFAGRCKRCGQSYRYPCSEDGKITEQPLDSGLIAVLA